MAKRKYLSEFGLNMLNENTILIQQDQLHQIDKLGINPHIYFIGRRPRISLDPGSIRFTDQLVSGCLKKQIQDSSISIPFELKNSLGTSNVKTICNYPYTELAVIDENEKIISKIKCSFLLAKTGPQHWAHLDLEILYIGQSYGKDGTRSAAQRLQNHSTLQGIYAEAIKNSPDQEIWLILSIFKPFLLMSFDGKTKEFPTTMKEDTEHIHKVCNTEISEQQQINFTEAALIRHFRPPYNKIYKDSFPKPAHSTYSECYDLDLNMVCVEFQSEVLMLRIWSEYIKPSWIHFCSFPLYKRQDRVHMFEFANGEAL